MDASDLVDFLLKDDETPLTVCYEMPQLPWQTKEAVKRDHSRGRCVRRKQCSDFSLAEMAELLEDLEQLITRPRQEQDVLITVKGHNWGGEQGWPANNEQAVKKSGKGKKARYKSKKHRSHLHDDPNIEVEHRLRQQEEKTKTSDSDRSKKKSKKYRNEAKMSEFDPCGEEADPVEIRAIIKAQHITKKDKDHNVSQIRDLQNSHHKENGKDKEPKMSKKKKHKAELEVCNAADDQSQEVKPTSTKKTREKKKKKEPKEKQGKDESKNERRNERKNESKYETKTLKDIEIGSKTGKKETKNEKKRDVKDVDHHFNEEVESSGNAAKPKRKSKRREAAEKDHLTNQLLK